MTGKDLRNMVNEGKTPIVEFTKSVEDLDERFDKGMMAYVTKVSNPDNSDCVEITFEEKDFTEYNKHIEKPNWYNVNTKKYDLKFSETERSKQYNGRISFYEMENEEIYNFNLIQDESMSLFIEYKNSSEKTSYIRWLENYILELKTILIK